MVVAVFLIALAGKGFVFPSSFRWDLLMFFSFTLQTTLVDSSSLTVNSYFSSDRQVA